MPRRLIPHTPISTLYKKKIRKASQKAQHVKPWGYRRRQHWFPNACLQEWCSIIMSTWSWISKRGFPHVTESISRRTEVVLRAKYKVVGVFISSATGCQTTIQHIKPISVLTRVKTRSSFILLFHSTSFHLKKTLKVFRPEHLNPK